MSDFKDINDSEQLSIFDETDYDMNLKALLHELNHSLGSNQLLLASELTKD